MAGTLERSDDAFHTSVGTETAQGHSTQEGQNEEELERQVLAETSLPSRHVFPGIDSV